MITTVAVWVVLGLLTVSVLFLWRMLSLVYLRQRQLVIAVNELARAENARRDRIQRRLDRRAAKATR